MEVKDPENQKQPDSSWLPFLPPSPPPHLNSQEAEESGMSNRWSGYS